MAIAPVNKFINLAVPVAPGVQKLYEVPTGTTSLLLYAQVANVGVGTYPLVTFWQKRLSRSTGNDRDIRVMKEVEIPPNDAVILVDGRMVLEKTAITADSLYIRGHQENVGIITGVDYDEPTGIATVMCKGLHNFNAGDPITMGGIYFTCGSTYTPGNNTTYDGSTGLLVLDLGTHTLQVGEYLKIKDNAMSFTCTEDSGATQHAYPRSTDPASGKLLTISAVTGTTATVQVLDTVPSTNTTAHTFVSNSGVPNSVSNNAYTGITTNIFPDPQQSYVVDHIVDQVGTSKTFSAVLGSAIGNVHTYQPAVHTFVRGEPNAVEVVTAASVLSGTKFNVYGSTYNPSTGEVTLTIGANSLANNDTIKIANDSLIYTCTMDLNATEHSYPRATDPASGATLTVAVATVNESIRVNVGKSYSGGFVAPLQMELTASILENSNV